MVLQVESKRFVGWANVPEVPIRRNKFLSIIGKWESQKRKAPPSQVAAIIAARADVCTKEFSGNNREPHGN